MADNILKNEFMWEEKQTKKKLYKNWKLYAIALGIIVIGAGTGLGVYYGVYENHSEVTKIDLNTLNTSAITGTENMTQDDAFNSFLNNNKDKNLIDLKNNATLSFTEPTYENNGLLTITANTNSKYNGNIKVTILKLESLSERDQILQKIKQAQQNNDMTNWGPGWLKYQEFLIHDIESHIFIFTQEQLADTLILENTLIKQFFAEVESDLTKWNLPKDFIKNFIIYTFNISSIKNTIIEVTAHASTKITSLIDNTIKNTLSFNGLLTINKINQTAIDGKENMTQDDAWNAFLENNTNITDLKENVEISTFTPPTNTTPGSITIIAKTNSKYIGSNVTIIINPIKKNNN